MNPCIFSQTSQQLPQNICRVMHKILQRHLCFCFGQSKTKRPFPWSMFSNTHRNTNESTYFNVRARLITVMSVFDRTITYPQRLHVMMTSYMETFSALLALYEGNPSVTGGIPPQRPMTRSFDVFFDLRPSKRLSRQSRRMWFETPSRSLWHHCNVESAVNDNLNKWWLWRQTLSLVLSDCKLQTILMGDTVCVGVTNCLNALSRGLFLCLFAKLRSNEGNKHQNNHRVSAQTVLHDSTFIMEIWWAHK